MSRRDDGIDGELPAFSIPAFFDQFLTNAADPLPHQDHQNGALHHIGDTGCPIWELDAIYGWEARLCLASAGLVRLRGGTQLVLTPHGRAKLAELREQARAEGESI